MNIIQELIMKNVEVVSVIVPVYNVEKYLRRCLDSIRNQTYRELEIILVDDQSPDKCPQICDQYAELDARIHVIHQRNSGLGRARNSGLLQATGKWVLYVDSDDWIENDCVEVMHNAAIESKADFITCNTFYEVQGNDITMVPHVLPEGIYDTEDMKQLLLTGGFVNMWTKMFLREWLLKNDLFQAPTYTGQDWGTYPNMVAKASKVYVLGKACYYYVRSREGCNTLGSELKLVRDFEEATLYILDFMQKNRLLERNRRGIAFYFLRNYYSRMSINEKSCNKEARIILDKIRQQIIEKEFGGFCLDNKNYIVLGSFSLRWEIQKGCLVSKKVNKHFCFSSLIAIFSKAWKQDIKHENSFRKSQIEAELGSQLVHEIETSDENTIFFIDFLEERFDILEVQSDIYVTDSEAFRESSLHDLKYIRKIHSGSKEFISLWKQACDKLVILLKKHLHPKQIVLIQNRMSLTYGSFSYKQSFKDEKTLRKINQMLEWMEDYFCSQMKGIFKIEKDLKYFFSDPFMEYGCGAEYANNAWYAKAGLQIFDWINTI